MGYRNLVIDENVLCVQLKEGDYCADILRSSVIRGSSHPAHGQIAIPTNKSRYRDATRKDFEDFMVDDYGFFEE